MASMRSKASKTAAGETKEDGGKVVAPGHVLTALGPGLAKDAVCFLARGLHPAAAIPVPGVRATGNVGPR